MSLLTLDETRLALAHDRDSARIYRLILNGEVHSRTDIGRILQLRSTSVSRVVGDLIARRLVIEAVGEALLFASKAGADPALVRQALMGGFASSRILEVHGERMVKRNFEPGFRIELHQKDLNLALEGARALGISLPSTAVAQQLFSSCAAHGGKAWDHSGMVRALEMMADHQVAKG
mgnify:CR=1 FL=1